jgi:hypothetical protein
MTKQFSRFENRKDRELVAFSAADNAALLADISVNGITGYVRQLKAGGPVSVPRFAADGIESLLIGRGWSRQHKGA